MYSAAVYTPIAIQYVPAVLTAAGRSLVHPNRVTKIEIITPSKPRPGLVQIHGSIVRAVIPESGLLKLKLLPSATFGLQAHYTVNFYYGGLNAIVEQSQRWCVPACPSPITTNYMYQGLPNLIDEPLFEIISITHSVSFAVENNSIVWKQYPPAIGQPYSITYQPAVTLDQLVVKD